MVTEKDIINMGRKIKRSKNPKTLAKYQIQIDAWIAELEEAQAQAQADILALEEKIKLEEEARAAEYAGVAIDNPALPGIAGSETKRVAHKIAEKAGPRKCYSYFEFERLHLRRSRF